MTDRRPAVSFLPNTAVLEMTYRCNHRCLFCSCPWENPASGFDKRPELSTAEWKTLISLLCAMGVNDLAFTGGEPLLKEDLEEIIIHAAGCETEHIETHDGELVSRKAPPNLHLLTNGRLATKSTLELCQRHQIQFSVSLPGLKSFTELTGVDNANGVLELFTNAHAMGIEAVAGITVTRLNLGELRETIAAALLAGANQILLNRFLPGGRGMAHTERLALTPIELCQALDITEEVLTQANRYGSLGTEVPRCLVDPNRYKRLHVATQCAAAIGFFTVDPSGYLRVCNHSPIRLKHFREIDALKTDPYWRRFTQKQYLPKECGSCTESGACDAGCREAAHITSGELCGLDFDMARSSDWRNHPCRQTR